MKNLLSAFSLIAILGISQLIMAQSPLAYHYQESKAAYERKDYGQFLLHCQKADSISPNHPTITYNLAGAYSLIGDKVKSLELVKKAVLMNTKLMPLDDADFENVMDTDGFKKITELYYELQKPIATSEVAFVVEEIDLHPESIAYNPVNGNFLLSSVHKNKIVEYNPKTQKTTDWKTSGEDGLWAVMGMKADKKSNSLWVCTVATKEMQDYSPSLEGKTAVIQYDLTTKKLMNRFDVEGGHWFGDLTIHRNGDVYITDSLKPIIYKISNGKLEVYRDLTNKLYNLQGLSFNGDKMYLADYKVGLYSHRLDTEEFKKIEHPDNMSSKGVDGLYYKNGKLITIQNGVKPLRVNTLTLNKEGNRIVAFEYLDMGRPELNEPTLGVVVDEELYYIANSPWGAYDQHGNFITAGLGDNIVLKTKLK